MAGLSQLHRKLMGHKKSLSKPIKGNITTLMSGHRFGDHQQQLFRFGNTFRRKHVRTNLELIKKTSGYVEALQSMLTVNFQSLINNQSRFKPLFHMYLAVRDTSLVI
ncbi:hypothetical protein [Stygiolobus sp. RP850M]|uniref:hypothetical protein n=1 Tax=Stygiolobus sp. RP850M TaxID=3133137 RepID=UPI00307DD2AD